ncbi:MAG TPA: hypothetical protein DCQ31_16785 [Bacteroidales bacterium]|nr:hypothetical protein [Bacteroidales bacterium]
MKQPDELILLCKKGNSKAQQELYNAYSRLLLGICFRYTGNVQEAEDVLQEVFVKIFERIFQFTGEGSFEGWLRRIAVNTALTYIQKEKKHKFHSDVSELQQADESEPELDFTPEELMSVLTDLPDGYRTVFNLYAIDGLKHKEIAEQLNIDINTSKSQYSRARKLIMQKLEFLQKEKAGTAVVLAFISMEARAEEAFRNQLGNFEIQPSKQVWSKVSRRMRMRNFMYKIGGINTASGYAAVALLLYFGISFQANKFSENRLIEPFEIAFVANSTTSKGDTSSGKDEKPMEHSNLISTKKKENINNKISIKPGSVGNRPAGVSPQNIANKSVAGNNNVADANVFTENSSIQNEIELNALVYKMVQDSIIKSESGAFLDVNNNESLQIEEYIGKKNALIAFTDSLTQIQTPIFFVEIPRLKPRSEYFASAWISFSNSKTGEQTNIDKLVYASSATQDAISDLNQKSIVSGFNLTHKRGLFYQIIGASYNIIESRIEYSYNNASKSSELNYYDALRTNSSDMAAAVPNYKEPVSYIETIYVNDFILGAGLQKKFGAFGLNLGANLLFGIPYKTDNLPLTTQLNPKLPKIPEYELSKFTFGAQIGAGISVAIKNNFSVVFEPEYKAIANSYIKNYEMQHFRGFSFKFGLAKKL